MSTLVGSGSTLSGSAARVRLHSASGVLAGVGSAFSAASGARVREHSASGILNGAGAAIIAVASRFVASGSRVNYVVAMHTERQALSQYTNFNFNSFCQFNGKFYGANDEGLFELTGDNDNGSQINAMISGGITDFGSSELKMIGGAYIGCRSTGDMILSLSSHDDGKWYDYRMVAPNVAGMYGRRVKPGRGLRSRYYEWKLANVNGCSFSIDSLELNEVAIKRRIGGAD